MKISFVLPLLIVASLFLGCRHQMHTQVGGARKDKEGHKAMIFNESNFEEEVLESDLPVMVDFWAPWCGPCNALTPVVNELAEEFEGKAVVGKVNVEENQSLAMKYNISAIPAILFFRDGKMVSRKEGVQRKDVLADELETLMED